MCGVNVVRVESIISEETKFEALYSTKPSDDYSSNYCRHDRNHGWGRNEGWEDIDH